MNSKKLFVIQSTLNYAFNMILSFEF